MIRRMLEWLFPRKCVLCRKLLQKEETDLCRACRVDQPEYPFGKKKVPHIAQLTAVWIYEGDVRRSIHRYKFNGARHYADAYGRLLAMRILRDLPQADVITWVPISRQRLRKRGYDQVALLAHSTAKELGRKAKSTLKKIRDNPPQSSLVHPSQRRANVLGVYKVKDPDAIKGKTILLLDDVITTGATAGECARVLLTAGAKEVHCAAVAAARK